MKVVNLSQSPLTLPTGEVIGKSETLEVKSLDEKHHVVAAWLEAGLIEKLAARTSKTEPTDKA